MFPNRLLSSFFFPRVPRARPGAAASEWGGLAGPGTGVARAARVLLLLPPAGARWRGGWVKTAHSTHECQGLGGSQGPPNPYSGGPTGTGVEAIHPCPGPSPRGAQVGAHCGNKVGEIVTEIVWGPLGPLCVWAQGGRGRKEERGPHRSGSGMHRGWGTRHWMWGEPGIGTEEQGLEIRMKIAEVGRSEARSSGGQDLGIRVKVRLGEDQKSGSGLGVSERRVGRGNGGQGAEPGRLAPAQGNPGSGRGWARRERGVAARGAGSQTHMKTW